MKDVLHVVSVLQFIVGFTFFWLIGSLVHPLLLAFIVCGPLQLFVSQCGKATSGNLGSISRS